MSDFVRHGPPDRRHISLQSVADAIVGYDDPVTLEHVPGLRDRFDDHERSDDDRFKKLLWGTRITQGCLSIIVLRSVGVPVEGLAPTIEHLFKAFFAIFGG